MNRQPSASSKLRRMLREFADGRRLNRFEAERIGDHCLPQTVHVLERRHGLNFVRVAEHVPGYGGCEVHTVRYSLSFEEQQRARALLDTP